MNLRLASVALLLLFVFLQACKLGYNRTKRPSDSGQKPPACAQAQSNVNLISSGEQIFKLLADLTCYQATSNGNLIGQALGNGDELTDRDSDKGYQHLVNDFYDREDETPVVVSTDYALTERFDLLEFTEINQTLERHWNKGGIVSISWSPLNPWASDQTTDYTDEVDLEALLEPSSDIYATWREYLDEVAQALLELEALQIPVLWRPLPEMNDDRYWWGINANTNPNDADNADLYINLWHDMYNYLTSVKLVNNLLWVYSPLDVDSSRSDEARSGTWAYPGDNWTDVVAPVVRIDSLQITEYEDFLDLGRPFALAEWGPTPGNSASIEGRFDATIYSDRLSKSYPFVSFWLAPFSRDVLGERSHLALIDLSNVSNLLDRSDILSLEDAKEDGLLTARGNGSSSSSSISTSSSSAQSSSVGF